MKIIIDLKKDLLELKKKNPKIFSIMSLVCNIPPERIEDICEGKDDPTIDELYILNNIKNSTIV